jgi:hypothetical protein
MAQATNLSTTSRFHNLSHEQLADAIDDHSDQVRRAPRGRRVIPPTKRTDVSAVCLGSRREGRLRPPLESDVVQRCLLFEQLVSRGARGLCQN